MSAADEAAIAIRAARENTKCEVICTFTFQKGAKGQYRTMMGVSPAQAAEEAGDKDVAIAAGRDASRKLDKAASKGVIHKNQAANKKSAINKRAASL